MAISTETSIQIADLLRKTVRDKLEKYQPETNHMPFHFRLLGKDRYAMFSFIHSMNTTFGISIWEQIAEYLAIGSGKQAQRHYNLFGEIDNDTENLITKLIYDLRKSNDSKIDNKDDLIKIIRKSIKPGKAIKHPDSVVDLYINDNKKEYYFDIKTAKPNKEGFVGLKNKLLKWVALRLSQNKNTRIETNLAIPYNPYHPEPYERWTLAGIYDLKRELYVGERFWNFVAGENIYDDLLDIFKDVGNELRPEIDSKFERLKKDYE